jgi:hypothetical protein
MSVHVEWVEASHCVVESLCKGDRVPEEFGPEVSANFALVLGGDDLVVIEGSRDQLLGLIVRMTAELAKVAL